MRKWKMESPQAADKKGPITRRGDREKAQIAMAMYREMGMIYWLEQATAEARQLG
jgi:hypothetical protein